MADTLNQGREIFRLRGCMCCHRYEGFDREADEISSVNQQIRQLEQQKAEWEREIGFSEQKANNPRTSDNEAKQLFQHSNDLKVRSTGLDAKIEQFDMRSHSLIREVKKVGPSLKEARAKLKKEWIPVWLKDPHQWREGTKMPTFRLDDTEIRAISAFIWQSGVNAAPPAQKPGDPAKGKEAFETRGCMACHSMGEGGQKQGGTFAANLSREGEKANYDYLVRWVHNPRQRSAPYCTFEKKDLTAEDYQRHNLPYVFDLEHTKCPNDGHELQVQQMTPMPSLRLTEDEARDVASYLITRKHDDAAYANTDYMDDANLKNQGLSLVRNYGCAGCHEIAGLRRAAHRNGVDQGRLEAHGAPGFRAARAQGRRRRLVHAQGLLRAQTGEPGGVRHGQGEGQTGPAQDAELQLLEAGNRRRDDAARRLGGCQRPCPVFLQSYRPAAGHHRRLVGGAQVQLHGLPQSARGAEQHTRHHDQVSGSGLERPEAAHADWRRRARESGLADAVPQQSGAQRNGHQSRWRAPVSESQDAHFQLLRWRDPQAGPVLRSHVVAGPAVHRRKAGSADGPGTDHGAAVVHQ